MLRIMLYIFLSLNLFVVRGQVVFYQDICKCGVTGAGFSTGIADGGFGQIEINIEPGSIIRKAFLICNRFGNAEPISINFNGSNLLFDSSNQLSSNYTSFSNGIISEISGIHAEDVTSQVNSSQNIYNINLPIQPHVVSLSGKFGACYLLVVYENSSLLQSAVSVILNNQDTESIVSFFIEDLLSINIDNPVGLAIHSDIIWDTISDGSNIFLNGNDIGLIGGSDMANNQWTGAGVKGHFFYNNEQLFGLDDDTPDNFMLGSDGLANINGNLNNYDTELNITLVKQPTSPYNIYLAFFLTYTTPCTEFPTQTSSDTTLCQGSAAQLFASGGQSYSWLPATGLSCTDCPNPIVTADSSRLYTVRIWNNDSCSVVRPIKVNVQPLPQFSGVGSTPTACGQNTGSAIAVAQNTTPLPLSYSINGAPFAFSSTYTGNFANISAGANTIILRDAFGCETDTIIQIGVTNTTNAFFTATPNSGAAPLSVSFTNQSTNATNYNWFIESDFVGDNLLQHTFDTSGSYTVTLIAWQNDPLCADTFSIQILVYDSLVIQIPNVFTPNGDGINDQFTITTNQPVTVEYHLFNRWGNVIAQDTKPTTAGSSNFVLPIWNGENYSDGTYFYVIRVVHDGKEYEFDGFLERIE